MCISRLQKTFDIIECVGVLHHMSEPKVGLGILTDVLKPGGLMKLGLYSSSARRWINKNTCSNNRNWIEGNAGRYDKIKAINYGDQ